MRKLGIRFTRAAADEWLCLTALACQPFVPILTCDVVAELLAERTGREASRRDEDWRT